MQNLPLTQQKLLDLTKKEDITKLSLRQIGEKIGIKNSPQLIKHHLSQLQKKGHINLEKRMNVFSAIEKNLLKSSTFLDIPVLGTANCGKATLIAQEKIDGYLCISSTILKNSSKNLFAVRAKGNSMNRANI